MRKITASYLFTGRGNLIEKGVVITGDNGKIVSLSTAEQFDAAELETYEGVLCPGFINTHCHIELSHLKGRIAPKMGLANFLRPISRIRAEFSAEQIAAAIEQAEADMIRAGIVAVGDISNDNTSFVQKQRGNLRYHTFVELFAPFGANLEERCHARFEQAIAFWQQVPRCNGSTASLAPHAPYTVATDLLRRIANFNAQNELVGSIHHQEAACENDLFEYGTGDFVALYRDFGTDLAHHFTPIGKPSSAYIAENLPEKCKWLLVHNTFSQQADLDRWKAKQKKIYWCLCPNANIYIENRLPDIDLFVQNQAAVTIGTDSLSSNEQLCVLSELKTISRHFPHIPLSMLLTWATYNGAKALDYEEYLGSIAIGKCPGINLIENIDMNALRLLPNSSVRRLV